MPTIESIETYFEEHSAPNRGKAKLRMPLEEGFAGLGLGGTESSETSLSAAYGVDKEDIKELTEGFEAHGKKEHLEIVELIKKNHLRIIRKSTLVPTERNTSTLVPTERNTSTLVPTERNK